MKSNFEKARAFDEEYARMTDPVMKARAKKRADQYYGYDLKETKQKLRQAKPHYALSRVLFPVIAATLILAGAIAAIKHKFPEIGLLALCGATALLLFAVATVTFFARGKLSESGFLDAVQSLTGNHKTPETKTATTLEEPHNPR